MALQPSNAYNITNADRALFDTGLLSLVAIEDAHARRDPRLAEYVVKLAQLDPTPKGLAEARQQGKFTYPELVDALTASRRYGENEISRLSRAVQRISGLSEKVEGDTSFVFGAIPRSELRDRIAELHGLLWRTLEGEANKPFLPDRIRLDEIIGRLWEDESAYARATLLDVIQHVPLKYGPWRALKKIFKASIERRDWEVFGAITARLDQAYSSSARSGAWDRKPTDGFRISHTRSSAIDPTRRTQIYLLRRAWRTLRQLGTSEAGLYVEVAVEVMRHYPAHTSNATNTWVLQHILFHEVGRYTQDSVFVGWRDRRDLIENRAYVNLWRQPRAFDSLLRLLESSRSSFMNTFAVSALKEDFSDRLGALDVELLARMAKSDVTALHEFLVWWFEEKAHISQDAYIAKGYHEIIIALLESKSSKARAFSARFIKAHKHDLTEAIPLDRVLWLVRHDQNDLHTLGLFLLDPEDSPYTLELQTWTDLLNDRRTLPLARNALLKSSAVEGLSLDWYKGRLHSPHRWVVDFAFELLEDPRRQRAGENWLGFYVDLLEPKGLNQRVAQLSLDNLQREREEHPEDEPDRYLHALDDTFLRALVVHPSSTVYWRLFEWLREGLVEIDQLGVGFLKQLIARDAWQQQQWASADWLGDYLKRWQLGSRYFEYRVADSVRELLSDPSVVTLDQLGTQWTIERAERAEKGESEYEFAKTVMLAQLPIAALAADPDAEDAYQLGGEALFKLLGLGLTPDAETARPPGLYRQLFTERYNRLRRHRDANAELLEAAYCVPDEVLTFELFKQMSNDADPKVRRLATIIGELELSRWAEQGEITFSDLYEIFTTGVETMCDLMRKAASKTPPSHTFRIDLERIDHLNPEDFFACGFLHASSPRARDFGIQVLKDFPEKFGRDAAALLRYADSADRRVREMIVKALWVHYHQRSTTRTEQDYQPEGADNADEFLSTKAPLEHTETLVELLRQVAFRLPATHPIKVELGRSTPATPTWRNKTALIETLRDIAVNDASFAVAVTPLLNELIASYGKTEHEACLVALTRIQLAHPTIALWDASLAS